MDNPKAKEYLRNQILTAPKEQLLLLLFDGAIRFADQGKAKLEAQCYEASCNLLIRSQRIVIELISSLNKEILPEDIYTNLARLYNFVYFRLIDGNLKKDPARIDDALRILRHLRETWGQAIEQDRRQNFPEVKLVERAEKTRKSLEMDG